MSHVATLISSPRRPAVADKVVRAAADVLETAAKPVWLHETVAADLFFEPRGAGPDRLAASLRQALDGAPVDVVIQPARGRRKRLFLADMDSTMIEQECIDELADYVGLKTEVSAITERAMRGEIAFEPALRKRVALLKDLPVGVVDEIIAKRISLMPGGRTLVGTMRAHGAYTCLVSGGFTVFTGPLAAHIGFHEHRSNALVVSSERLAGRVEEPILGREAKIATLIELRERLGLCHEDTLAVGDGANDLAMLGEAG
ncbi:MAG TPA: phosphoserine phosphatase SerB, partial [Beijerinckiaceae bacterium]|nr:phosphoserine phosphatase SerB [Beijerinckiaceae bacterium]